MPDRNCPSYYLHHKKRTSFGVIKNQLIDRSFIKLAAKKKEPVEKRRKRKGTAR